MAAAKPFGTLFQETTDAFKKRFQPLLIGAILAAAAGIPLHILTPNEQMPADSKPETLALVVLFGLVSFVVSAAVYLAYMLIGVKGEKSFQKAVKHCPRIIWPLFMVTIWTIVRTYTWLVVVGLVFLIPAAASGPQIATSPWFAIAMLIFLVAGGFALVLGPRYTLAPYIYLQEGIAPKKAVDASYKRTKCYWWKIVGSGLLLGLILGAVMLVLMFVIGVIGGILGYTGVQSVQGSETAVMVGVGLIAGPLSAIVSQLIQGFQLIFWAHMTQTITAHPRKG